MTTEERLAQLLFPDINKTVQDYEDIYPPRQLPEGARVTRFAPSPTGFMHIGNLFSALISKLTANVSGGVFNLRIEDTDKKREIENGIDAIFAGLKAFNVMPDEGFVTPTQEKGIYGPYQQSKRKEIYQTVAKELVKQGLAYPCFCSPEELDEIRAEQEKENVNKGYYQKWAKCRSLSFEQIEENIKAGKPFVLRLKSNGDESKKCFFDDMIKGKIEMPENVQDIVLLKTDGIPTYHFAHAVDDHFMRTTHVIRGDEWISSVPVHLQLFKMCGFKAPKYAHIAPIMKEENGGKRKLSKRKDPEAAVAYYAQQGYTSTAVIEYLLTLANSNFEDWRRANKTAEQSEFPFNIKKMSLSGALFDLVKLDDISKNIISTMSAQEVFEQSYEWAKENDEKLFALYEKDHDFAKSILAIDRDVPKPRKDIAKWSDIFDYISFYYDETLEEDFTLPESIDKELAVEILKNYIEVFNANDDKDTWFGKIKELCPKVGCTPNVKEYKKNPDQFKGHVGDVSTVIRIAVTCRKNTPDLHAIMALLGNDKVKERINKAIAYYENN